MPPTTKTMECLIPVINKIEDMMDKTGTREEINLPQIAVIGEQSVGKTSVLESLVGIPFLPKGDKIVTRTPIVIRLIQSKDGVPWCEFDHKPNIRFTDFKKVENEIRAQTEQIAGTNSGISHEKIKLTIHSPKVLTLTVVDLPGITKVPVGDQPETIEQETKDLVLDFIEKKETIILAVVAGDVNIANSYSIQLAKQVDPDQNRTIVVVTKLDKATEDLNPVLKGETIPVKLGIIGVVNRSSDKQNFLQVRDAEAKFMRETYPDMAHLHGTAYLSGRLNTILMQHIRDSCPNLDIRVKELIKKHTECLAKLGQSALKISPEEKREIMTDIVDSFAKEYKAQVDGQSRSELVSEILTQGARIDAVIMETLRTNLDSLLSISSWTDFQVLTVIRNANPVGSVTFSPGPAVEFLSKLEIRKMKPVAAHIASLFHQEMLAAMGKCSTHRNRFPDLASEMETIIRYLLEDRLDITRQILDTYIDIQAASGLTANMEYRSEFENSLKTVSPIGLANMPLSKMIDGEGDPLLTLSGGGSFPVPDQSVEITGEQKAFCEVVRKLVEKYFEIVRKQVQDFVPKALLHSLVYHVADKANPVLMSKLMDPAKIEALIRECESVEKTRAVLKQELMSFSEASQLLEEIRAGIFYS